MNRGVIADTGPLYAAADRDDQYHLRAQREVERLTREQRELIVSWCFTGLASSQLEHGLKKF